MKIKTMSRKQLFDAIKYMRSVPKIDPCFSGWNFDQETWRNKLNELFRERLNRTNKINGLGGRHD